MSLMKDQRDVECGDNTQDQVRYNYVQNTEKTGETENIPLPDESIIKTQDSICNGSYTEEESRRVPGDVSSTSSVAGYVVRSTKSVDAVPPHKSNVMTRLHGINSDLAQQKYKLSLTSPHPLRPLGVTVKKPKLCYSLDGCKEVPREMNSESSLFSGNNISSSNTSESTNRLTNIDCTDSSNHLTDSDGGFTSDYVSDKFDCSSAEKMKLAENKNTFINISDENENGTRDLCDCAVDSINKDDNIFSGENVCADDENVNSDNIGNLKVEKEADVAGLGDCKPLYTEVVGDDSLIKMITSDPVHSCKSSIIKSEVMDNCGDQTSSNVQFRESKMGSLKKIFENCPEGVDMKLSLFMASCSHNMRILQPFPHKILVDDEANRLLLYCIAEDIPCVSMLKALLNSCGNNSIRKEILPIVDWLIRSEDPRLEEVNEEEYKSILNKIDPEVSENCFPSKMFRIKTRCNSQTEESWQSAKNGYSTKLAYHTCKVDQAHTLLYYGLNKQLNKRGVFGPGIYLTDSLVSCINACNPGNTWGKSSIATKVKIALIAEFVSNHNVTTYNGEGHPFNKKIDDNEKSNYFFISKPKIVRLRYLLVYIIEDSVISKQTKNNLIQPVSIRSKFLKRLKLVRMSLLIVTIAMGIASASKKGGSKSIFSISLIGESLQKYYHKVFQDFQNWSLWQYIETPYIAVHLRDSVPHVCSDFN